MVQVLIQIRDRLFLGTVQICSHIPVRDADGAWTRLKYLLGKLKANKLLENIK